MVLIKIRAGNDLKRLFNGLLNWSVKTNTKKQVREKHLSREDVIAYYDKLIAECYNIDKLFFHFSTRYPDHIKFGKYVHSYHPSNKRTTIYIIYDITKTGCVDIKKIMTNYKTISGFN